MVKSFRYCLLSLVCFLSFALFWFGFRTQSAAVLIKKDFSRFVLRHGQILTGVNWYNFEEYWLRMSFWLELCIIEHADIMTI